MAARRLVLHVTLAFAAFLAVCGPSNSTAQTEPSTLQYQVKAVYVYNFLKFVDWPSGTFKHEQDPINVCVIGKHPIGKALEPIKNQTAKRRPIQLLHLTFRDDVAHCQVLFVAKADPRRAATLFEKAAQASVLTVSDMEDFIDLGGMIGFVIQDDRVLLEINLQKTRAAKLEISAKVLEIASTVVMD